MKQNSGLSALTLLLILSTVISCASTIPAETPVQTQNPPSGTDAVPEEVPEALNRISVIKHAAVRIESEKVIYIDPYRIGGQPLDADIIFITHTHGDHFSPSDIRRIAKEGTVIVTVKDGEEAAKNLGYGEVQAVEPGRGYTVSGINFRTVPAYNLTSSYHPEENGWVGYIIDIDGISYYFAGDTDATDELKAVKADVFFVPVGGTYTMTAEEAAKAVNKAKPSYSVPYHYGAIVGSRKDAVKFISDLKKSKGYLLQ